MSASTVWVDDHFIAGDIALDFANTVYRRTPHLGADLLNDTGALRAWLHRVGLLPAINDLPDGVNPSGAELRQARAIRGLLWAIFEAQKDGRDPPSDSLAGLFDIARRGVRHDVSVGPDGSIRAGTARGALAALALCAITLVLSPPHPVRTCDRCGWFFLDTSRGRRRRWCSMRTCGNQAKAERYRGAHR